MALYVRILIKCGFCFHVNIYQGTFTSEEALTLKIYTMIEQLTSSIWLTPSMISYVTSRALREQGLQG